MPPVQNPHCAAFVAVNASCAGVGSAVAPCGVVTAAKATSPTGVTHEATE